ncbi:MAG: tRNA uridine-5-carboxymethylaminomethyl(34) synthesis GTPase MnmE [Pseudomonadota bacterium]
MTAQPATIFAPATARGRAAVAVIRVSGPHADAALEALAGALPEARQAVLRTIRRPSDGEALDRALVIRFSAGASFTGEKSFEIQCHGGGAVVASLLAALEEMPGLRLAEPGEFTRRALENGRIELLEVEALGDLVNAETEAQRRQAMRAMRGALGAQAEEWRRRMIRARALLEAVLDFADEEVPEEVAPEVETLLSGVSAEIDRALAGAGAAERIRDGFEVALVGPPNAGKSTLLNALAGREAALTSEIAGTTRDVIEVHMDLGGLPVTLLDTAGLREAEDRIEKLGVDRARSRAEAADLRVYLCPPGETESDPDFLRPEDIRVRSKADLAPGEGLGVSALTGEGLDALTGEIANRLSDRAAGASAVVTARHRKALEEGRTHITAALEWLHRRDDNLELAAEEIRLATRGMEALLGRVDAERILDDIFAEFCLGK